MSLFAVGILMFFFGGILGYLCGGGSALERAARIAEDWPGPPEFGEIYQARWKAGRAIAARIRGEERETR